MSVARAKREAKELVGGFSEPSKMPGLGYGIPAFECKIGSILAARKDTVCSDCYARKGRYVFPRVQSAQYRRFRILMVDTERWADNIIRLLPRCSPRERFFRWHDSGDLQGMPHLRAIVRIARELPEFRFWLPTKEYALVRQHIREFGAFPPNLAVRVSAPMLGNTSSRSDTGLVSYVAENATCPAYRQGGRCLDCRACWDTTVPVIVYKRH